MPEPAQPAPADFLQEVTSFAQQKGYVWGPSPEIYGGMSGFYDYGPLGKLLKNNVEHVIRKVLQQSDFWEIECPTIMPRKVWEASGHVQGFHDPLIEAEDGSIFRIDKLLEELFPDREIRPEDYLRIIQEENIRAPSGAAFKKDIRQHSLMMKTTVGMDLEAYNRPETATTTYLPFPRYFEFFRKRLPFGVFQIGKAYRNEISPRQFVLRMREFTQAEAQMFIFEDQKESFSIPDSVLPLHPAGKDEERIAVGDALGKGHFKNPAFAHTVALAHRLFVQVGIPEDRIRIRQHAENERAFYADDAWDIEVRLNSFGWTEMCGIHDRTTYDLKQHGEHSGKDLRVSDETHKKEMPHVLEIAFGLDRMTFALLDLFYNPQAVEEGKTTFHIPAGLAPIKVAVLPLMKKDGLPEIAKEIHDELSGDLVCRYDSSGSVGRRYLRASEEGTPYCVTVDYQSREDGTVTLRDRDTEEQVRVQRTELNEIIRKLLAGTIPFEQAGESVKK